MQNRRLQDISQQTKQLSWFVKQLSWFVTQLAWFVVKYPAHVGFASFGRELRLDFVRAPFSTMFLHMHSGVKLFWGLEEI